MSTPNQPGAKNDGNGDDGNGSDDNADEAFRPPLEDSIDLHTFRPRDVASVVEEYVYAASEAGFQEVRIIHGKGKGVLRDTTHAVLRRHPLVRQFGTAQGHRGSWGATLVVIGKRSSGVGVTELPDD